MSTCIYAGSFDPITNGHLDIIKRAQTMFDNVVIAVGEASNKKYTFSSSERVSLIKKLVSEKVTVQSFEGLLVDFAFNNNIKHIVRGVRNSQDFDYEKLLHEVNISQKFGLDTVILVADQSMSHISSSAVKELCKHHGDIHEYVPLAVKDALELKLHNIVIKGITGEIAVGKSFLSENPALIPDIKSPFIAPKILNLDFDTIVDFLYKDTLNLSSIEFRKGVANKLNTQSLPSEAGKFKREVADIVFKNQNKLEWLNDFSKPYVLSLIRKYLRDIYYETIKTDTVILMNSSLLADLDLLHLCNNNVYMVVSSKEKQMSRLFERGLTREEAIDRVVSQLSTEKKINKINAQIKKDNYGSLKIIEN